MEQSHIHLGVKRDEGNLCLLFRNFDFRVKRLPVKKYVTQNLSNWNYLLQTYSTNANS